MTVIDSMYIQVYKYIPYKFCIYGIYNGAGLYIRYRHITTRWYKISVAAQLPEGVPFIRIPSSNNSCRVVWVSEIIISLFFNHIATFFPTLT